MNITDFTTILQQPQALTNAQTLEVKSIIDEFPYFQSARAIYLKGLKNKGSFKYNQELKTTAAYTTDRSILFDFITSEEFIQNEISEKIKHNSARLLDIPVKDVVDISVDKKTDVDDALSKQIQETEPTLNPELFEPKLVISKIANISESETEQQKVDHIKEHNDAPAEDILQIGKPFQFNKSERHSFNEWLKLTAFKPIQRDNQLEESEQDEVQSLSRKKKFELIDKFISTNPKIKPAESNATKENVAKERMIQPEALMTETLARIYVEQKNYKKAIQSYKILSLKYPEKSGFFADRIKAVKKLQDKNIE